MIGGGRMKRARVRGGCEGEVRIGQVERMMRG